MRYPLYPTIGIFQCLDPDGAKLPTQPIIARGYCRGWAFPPQLTAYPKDDSRCHSGAIASMLG